MISLYGTEDFWANCAKPQKFTPSYYLLAKILHLVNISVLIFYDAVLIKSFVRTKILQI